MLFISPPAAGALPAIWASSQWYEYYEIMRRYYCTGSSYSFRAKWDLRIKREREGESRRLLQIGVSLPLPNGTRGWDRDRGRRPSQTTAASALPRDKEGKAGGGGDLFWRRLLLSNVAVAVAMASTRLSLRRTRVKRPPELGTGTTNHCSYCGGNKKHGTSSPNKEAEGEEMAALLPASARHLQGL